tara:strand:+ start:153 stop:383 length:231 start_codon:yes stop_codon:yes gene_type:complete
MSSTEGYREWRVRLSYLDDPDLVCSSCSNPDEFQVTCHTCLDSVQKASKSLKDSECITVCEKPGSKPGSVFRYTKK